MAYYICGERVTSCIETKNTRLFCTGENVEINRISLAPTINECIRGLGNENAFNTKERKIYAYKILVEEGDESLYDSNYLYYNDLVKDALLTHEYLFTKIICPQEVLMCEVSFVEKESIS